MIIRIIFLLFSFSLVKAQDQSLKVVFENVKDNQGAITVALYNSKDQFMKTHVMSLTLIAQKGKVVGYFENLPPGTYAISAIHDANNNKELDTNFIGIPKEGFGFSNDAMGRFGPPNFEAASFEFPKQKEVVIKLKYW